MLRLLPRSVRARHGRDMELLAAEELEAAWQEGLMPWLVTWFRALIDVAGRSLYERRRITRSYEHGGRRVSMVGADMKTAIRGFVREPGMTGLIVAMLALGIAANTAVFSLVNGLFLRPLPFPASERLVYLNETAPRWNLEYTGVNYPDFVGWRERVREFDGMALYGGRSFNLSDGENADRVSGLEVTHDFGSVLGIEPVLGRFFTGEEDRPAGPQVALLGWSFWQTRYGGARDVVGRAIRLDGESVTIVGVLPRFARAARFRRLAKDYERLPDVLRGLHFLVFAILMLPKAIPLLTATGNA
jgi:hypothetical protein